MRDLAGFRNAVREYRRAVGRTQQQLARAVGLHPDVLSHKLNGRDHAVLTAADTTKIVITLAGWAAVQTRAEVTGLLELMDVPATAIPTEVWSAAPLAHLIEEADAGQTRAPTAEVPGRSIGLSAGEWRLRPVAPPTPPAPLIGRRAELDAIRAALSNSRLVTLTGVGGTGKTRLAVEAAHELAGDYPGGVAFADLAAVHEPLLLPIAVAAAIGLRPASAEIAEEQLVDALRRQHVLLVLDNLEQLLDATPLLGRLLAAAPRLQILATSRIPLRLYGETLLRIPPLRVSDAEDSEAVQLFVQRAAAARFGFHADGDELAAIAAICAALDGLPLAIELAAARVKLHPPTALYSLLADRLAVLTGGPRDLPHRQQTLRATLDWSYGLLDGPGQQLFACLGVFSGPFDTAAATAVHASGEATVDMLARLEALCDQSLLEAVPGAPPRFRLLETVREYALARLAEAGGRDAACARHLDHYLRVATASGLATSGPDARAGLDDLEAAYPNICAALDFAHEQGSHDPGALDAGLRLAVAAGRLWERRLSLAEGVWHFDRLLGVDAEIHGARDATRARAVIEQCTLECFRGNYPRTVALAEQGRVLCESLHDHAGLSKAHRFLGEAAFSIGDDANAEPHFRAQLAEAEQTGDQRVQAEAYNMLGQLARHRHDWAEATRLLRAELRLFGAVHDRDGVANAINSLAETARDARQADRARRLFTAALHGHRQTGSARGLAYDLEGLAAAAALSGEGRQALIYLGAAHSLRERSGPLPPAEQAILDSILTPALEHLTPQQQQQALTEGRTQPIEATLTHALHAGTPASVTDPAPPKRPALT